MLLTIELSIKTSFFFLHHWSSGVAIAKWEVGGRLYMYYLKKQFKRTMIVREYTTYIDRQIVKASGRQIL